jgi:hypothetical protein
MCRPGVPRAISHRGHKRCIKPQPILGGKCHRRVSWLENIPICCALFDKATKNTKLRPIVQDTTTLPHFIHYTQYRPHGNDIYDIVSTAENPLISPCLVLGSLSSSLERLLDSFDLEPHTLHRLSLLEIQTFQTFNIPISILVPIPIPVLLLQESQYGLHSFKCRHPILMVSWGLGFLAVSSISLCLARILFPDFGKSTYGDRLLAVPSPLCSPWYTQAL